MKKLFYISFLGFIGILPNKHILADLLNVTFDGTNYTVQRYNTSTGDTTDLKSFTSPYGTCAGCTFVDEYEGKLYLGGASGWAIYDVESNSVSVCDLVYVLVVESLDEFCTFTFNVDVSAKLLGIVNFWSTSDESTVY